MKRRIKPAEFAMQTLFLVCGLTAIAFVLLITVYLILAGLPAIREIGLTAGVVQKGLGRRGEGRALPGHQQEGPLDGVGPAPHRLLRAGRALHRHRGH